MEQKLFSKRDAKQEKVAMALLKGEQLTGLDIINRFRYLNYTDLISKLRKKGIPVQTKMVKVRDVHFAVYYVNKVIA